MNKWIKVTSSTTEERKVVSKIILDLNEKYSFKFDVEDVEKYNVNDRNRILKAGDKIIKVYEKDWSKNKEKRVFENINRKFYELDNILVFDRLLGEHLIKDKIMTSSFGLLKDSLTNFWKLNENLISSYNFKRDFGDKREAYLKEALDSDQLEEIAIKKIIAWKSAPISKLVFSHGDLNSGNIIFTENGFEFIDFEFSGLNEEWFDLSSMIIENDFNEEQINSIIKTFEISDVQNFKISYTVFALRTCIDWFIRYKETNNNEIFNVYKSKLEKVNKLLMSY